MLPGTMHTRAVALALALLLLLTQQFSVLHGLAHSLPSAGGGYALTVSALAVSAQPAASPSPGDAEPSSSPANLPPDGACQVCLALAAIGLATLPGVLGWWVARSPQRAPTLARAPTLGAPAAALYRARAPPSPVN